MTGQYIRLETIDIRLAPVCEFMWVSRPLERENDFGHTGHWYILFLLLGAPPAELVDAVLGRPPGPSKREICEGTGLLFTLLELEDESDSSMLIRVVGVGCTHLVFESPLDS